MWRHMAFECFIQVGKGELKGIQGYICNYFYHIVTDLCCLSAQIRSISDLRSGVHPYISPAVVIGICADDLASSS